jgi:bleomycin hydrolase
MYTVYWEYIEKAKGFVRKRGNSAFAQGSESNAVTGNYKKYGIVPLSDYPGKVNNEKFYNHDIMYNEMNSYLQSVKKNNSWNEEEVISTIKSILNTYMGAPPAEITYDGRKYTPKQYLSEVLKLNMDDYVDILSYMQKPFWKKVEYDVDDNWWHDSTYYNVPAEVFIGIIKKAVRSGYTIAIGGDVSEPGFDREYQVGIVPTFDIPSEYIDDYAKQMRFTDKITQDDHGMHIVGYTEKNGRDWYLVKDSGSGSRNNNPNAKEFGYYFINEDYVKLKMMDFTIHKDAVKEIISKF